MSKSYIITILGDTSVGKTTILNNLLENEIGLSQVSTVGYQQFIKTFNHPIKKQDFRFQFIDTAGQEAYRAILTSHVKKASAFLLVFSLADEKSFNSLPDFMNIIKNNAKENAPIVLIANKTDLKDNIVITDEQINNFIESNNNDENNPKISKTFLKTCAIHENGCRDVIDFLFTVIDEAIKDYNYDPYHYTANSKPIVVQEKKNKCCN